MADSHPTCPCGTQLYMIDGVGHEWYDDSMMSHACSVTRAAGRARDAAIMAAITPAWEATIERVRSRYDG